MSLSYDLNEFHDEVGGLLGEALYELTDEFRSLPGPTVDSLDEAVDTTADLIDAGILAFRIATGLEKPERLEASMAAIQSARSARFEASR